MAIQKKYGRFCHHCNSKVVAERSTPCHVLHFLLAVLTGGLWLPVWVLLSFRLTAGWCCPNCGSVTGRAPHNSPSSNTWAYKLGALAAGAVMAMRR